MRSLLLALALLTFSDLSSAHALRCGNQLINHGDTRGRVRALCGEPTDVALRIEREAVAQRVRGGVVAQQLGVPVESWTLNFGPRRFMQRVTFREGRVIRVETLGRGYRPEQLGTPGRNVHLGETRDRVRASWGEPAEINRSVIARSAASHLVGGTLGSVLIEVQRERWVFNFGPQRFMRCVVFEDGRVVAIETLHRGYRDAELY